MRYLKNKTFVLILWALKMIKKKNIGSVPVLQNIRVFSQNLYKNFEYFEYGENFK